MKSAHGATTALAAAAAMLMMSGQAQAKPQGSTEQIVVGKVVHADLDLTTVRGRRLLDLRVHHLVSEACTGDNLASSKVRRLCKQAILDTVAPQVRGVILKAEASKTALKTRLTSTD